MTILAQSNISRQLHTPSANNANCSSKLHWTTEPANDVKDAQIPDTKTYNSGAATAQPTPRMASHQTHTLGHSKTCLDVFRYTGVTVVKRLSASMNDACSWNQKSASSVDPGPADDSLYARMNGTRQPIMVSQLAFRMTGFH